MDFIRRGSFRKAVAPKRSQGELSQPTPGENFFENQNYQLFIQCLDKGGCQFLLIIHSNEKV